MMPSTPTASAQQSRHPGADGSQVCRTLSELHVAIPEIAANMSHVAVDLAPPTVESLGKEVARKNAGQPPREWEPITPAEADILRQVRAWLGAERFRAVHRDMLVQFLRGYHYRVDWAAASFAYLDAALRERAASNVDDFVVTCLGGIDPARLELVDSISPAGPIGHDAEGHIVAIERFCATSAKEFLAAFSDEEFMRLMVARRECVRAVCTANSIRRDRRTYRVVTVVDLRGLGMGHADGKFRARFRRLNDFFAWHYPESAEKILFINAPRVFSMVWAVIKPFLHPVTQARCRCRRHEGACGGLPPASAPFGRTPSLPDRRARPRRRRSAWSARAARRSRRCSTRWASRSTRGR